MTPWKTLIWQQFGAAIDMLDNALRACPVQQWRDSLWNDPTDGPEYTEIWLIVYHTLFWLDLYLTGGSREDFAPPAPFLAGSLPPQPYSKEELQDYLLYCRRKCQTIFENLTDKKANRSCKFSWAEAVSFAELQRYNMRHVQEHVSQQSLHLGLEAGSALDWVVRAGDTAV